MRRLEAVIVSGLPAVGKTTIARIIAEKLHLRVFGGGDILKEMAEERGVTTSGEDWWDTKEGIRFLEERKKSPKFDQDVDRRLLKKAAGGNVVITSYPLPWLSKKGIKVWLSGSAESRAKRMAKRDKKGIEECKRVIAVRDAENYKIYKKIYKIEFGKDLTPFDLVVGTDGMSVEEVGKEVLRYVKTRKR
ncbi:MAG: cytidylate kinase family protein [Thaumarchaeota archaeon]|nr:cytidylate kinase family protein [Nitrososphaerota archaeon]